VLIDVKSREVIATRIRLDLADRQNVLASQVRAIMAEMTERGALRSGMTVTAVDLVVRQEALIRAELAWQTVAKVITAQGLPATDALTDEAKVLVEEHVRASSPDLSVQLANATHVAGRGSNSTDAHLRDAFARVGTEIDIAMMAGKKQQETTGATTINIYQPYGIVQTGAGSSATFSPSAGSIQALTEALTSVQRALEKASGGDAVTTRETLEIVEETKSELAKPKPNGLRVKAGISAVAATIRTMGSMPEAYQLLKGGASLIGIELP
jgi:hypothetical protein